MTDPLGAPLPLKDMPPCEPNDGDLEGFLDLEVAIDDDGLSAVGDILAIIEQAVQEALRAGFEGDIPNAEMFVRIVSNDESHALNHQYRGKDKATNVLSFPGVEPEEMDLSVKRAVDGGPPLMLGDIIVAAPVVAKEAKEQGKAISHHLVHLIVHGVLHLLGYDHIEDEDADIMEDLERTILAKLDISDPYRDLPSHD